MAPKMDRRVVRGAPFFHTFRDPALYVDFMLDLVAPWLTFGTLGPPSGSLLAPVGSLLASVGSPFAPFWFPFGSLSQPFRNNDTFWCNFRSFLHFLNLSNVKLLQTSCFLGHPQPQRTRYRFVF